MARRRRCLVCGFVLFVMSWSLPGSGQKGSPGGEWRAYSADEGSTRYSPLDQINRDNVRSLQVAWTWKFDNFFISKQTVTTETTPLMVDGVLYFTAGQRRTVVAADAATGETLWTWRPDEGARFDQAPRKVHRGVAYWPDGGDGRIVVVTPGYQLVSLNAKTGEPASGFGENGVVDLFRHLDNDLKIDPVGKIGNSSPPVIANGVIVVGPAMLVGTRVNKSNVRADVSGFDARTGRKLWTFHTIPRKGEAGYETWENGSADYTGNAGVWGPFSADPELGIVYLPVEAPTNDVYGGHRPGNNLYSNSLVALNIRTGRRIWHQQLIHHDIWDYDVPAHPILLDITVDGKPIKAIVQLTKQAFAYVFDRATGQPVWPMPEMPVPASDVPGEQASATQPMPSKPPAFDVQGLTEDKLIDFTPELRAEALKVISQFRYGPVFTPPSLIVAGGNRGTILVPGYGGGANWQSGAADPETGFVYVGSTTNPNVMGLNRNNPAETKLDADYTMGAGSLALASGLRLLKPPYGRITAYDMNKGEIAWQIPNGDTPAAVTNTPRSSGTGRTSTRSARTRTPRTKRARSTASSAKRSAVRSASSTGTSTT